MSRSWSFIDGILLHFYLRVMSHILKELLNIQWPYAARDNLHNTCIQSYNIPVTSELLQYDEFIKTTKKELAGIYRAKNHRANPRNVTGRTKFMMRTRLVRSRRLREFSVRNDHRNTTAIRILKNGSLRRFDFMIIDEASKTTLQEFLLTADIADRWIIVGDTSSSPRIRMMMEIAMQVNSCIEKHLGNACLDVFMASRYGHTTIVATDDRELEDTYQKQCKKVGVKLHRAGTDNTKADFGRGQIVIGTPASILRLSPPNRHDFTIRNCEQLLYELEQHKDRRMAKQWTQACKRQSRENSTWESRWAGASEHVFRMLSGIKKNRKLRRCSTTSCQAMEQKI